MIDSCLEKQAACAACANIVTLENYAVEDSRWEDNECSEYSAENSEKLARVCDEKLTRHAEK